MYAPRHLKFCGEGVPEASLTHILKEFRSKGITRFIDNDIERSNAIGPELKEAIRVSKITIVLISSNHSSSTWCLNEVVEIMKYKKELRQTVMTTFCEVDSSDVKRHIGEFGSVFEKTCAEIQRRTLRDGDNRGGHETLLENRTLKNLRKPKSFVSTIPPTI